MMPNDRPRDVSVWVMRLSLGALPSLVATFLRHGRYRVQFTAATPAGLAVARTLRALGMLRGPARPVEFSGHGERVDDPSSPAFRIQAQVNAFSREFSARHAALIEGFRYPDRRVRPDRVRMNIQKAAAHITYYLLAFVEFTRWAEMVAGYRPDRLVVVSSLALLADALDTPFAGPGIELRCPWDRHNLLALRVLRALARCLGDIIQPRRDLHRSLGTVGVSVTWGFDASARLDDLFWWRDAGIGAERVILCFEETPATEDLVAEAERLGIRAVVMNPRLAGQRSDLVWQSSPGAGIALRRLAWSLRVFGWGLARGRIGRWLAGRALDMLHHATRLEDFFAEYNVRAFVHCQDTDQDYVSIACDATGTGRIGYHWSNQHWPSAYQGRLHQVYFVWGPRSARVTSEAGSCVDHVLVSGCIVRGAHPGAHGSAAGFSERERIVAAGAQRVVALFDTSLPCEGFFDFFLRRALEDARWGLLIKPKADTSLPWCRRRPQLEELYRRAMASGRVRVLDWRLSPCEVAAAADISVGVDVNSATVLAALAGHRAIHMDYVRLQATELVDWADAYKEGPNRIVFDDPNRLWAALNRFFDDPSSTAGLGFASEAFLRQIDWFRDGKAGQRIGAYVRWYLEGCDRGLARDEALAEATRAYASTWGAETVLRSFSESPRGAQ